ncbi:hypothetical protein [Pontiella sp.]|uniref:hypothetical protein n=1 Tax=Pontiella sp. TaxID=2837462 RepID=UPI003569164A
MNKSIYSLAMAGVFMLGALAEAASLPATLVMPGDKKWEGSIMSRDGEWIEFQTGTSPRPIRLGANTIVELQFDIKLDQDRLNEMNQNREYERVIDALNRALDPYREYDDIPSNLTLYKSLLMELYYKTRDYEKTLEISAGLVQDDRDPDLQMKARIYGALALIDAGEADRAEALLKEYGWDEELNSESAPERLYITAKLLALKGQFAEAMELAAYVVAFNSQDQEWMQPAELLCAQVYTELGKENPVMLDSAEEVIRQISLLYKNTNEDDQAQQLKLRIDELRAEQELNKSIEESEEA